MASIKVTNKLNGGIDTDTTSEAIDNTKLRDASNIDVLTTGEYSKLTNIKGTTNILTYLPDTTDLPSLNVLGVFNVEILADYTSTNVYVTNKAIAIFTFDVTNKSQIFIVDLVRNEVIKLYPNPASSADLDFPPEGTISASFTIERGVPEIYWDDNKNELRKLTIKYSTSPSFVFPTLADISVRHKYGGMIPTFESYGVNGYTTAGTYQVAFRFYNTTKNTSSKWSLFTNPIPMTSAEGCFTTLALGEGGQVGQIIQKSIIISIDFTNTSANLYDSIQLAVVKNVDGLTIPSNTVYITLPSKEWYDAPSLIEYSDAIGFESPYPLESIITEDASIKSAKAQLIKSNVLVRGNITYYNFNNDRGSVDFDDAYTIKSPVCYSTGNDAVNKKSHFREEVYAYAIAYFDEFFNFGLVQPLDFTKVYKMNAKRTLTVTSIETPSTSTYNQLTIVVSSTAGLECGDYLRYQNKAYQVCEVNSGTSMLIKYRPDLVTTSNGADLEVLYGQEGNQMQGWSWKFPARSDNKFTIIQDYSAQGIGLKLKGVKNHPSWAKGFVVVRQDRIKNILFQSPHIPAIAAQGVPSQGIGPITYEPTDPFNPAKFNYRNADYKGALDCVVPKIFGLGHAVNIASSYLNMFFAFYGVLNPYAKYYTAYYSIYSRQKKVFTESPTAEIVGDTIPYTNTATPLIDTFGAETPRALFVTPPDYVFNYNGLPVFNYDLKGNEKVNIVDAVALYRSPLKDEEPYLDIANAYTAITSDQYYYSKNGYVTRTASNLKDYFVPLSSFDADNSNIIVNKEYSLVLGQTPQTIDNYIFNSDTFKNINIIGGTEQLSLQQGQSPTIPGTTNSFFNVTPNQRAKLLLVNNPILDFTKALWDSIVADDNIFPEVTPSLYSDKMYRTEHLKTNTGDVGEDHNGILKLILAPVKTVFTDKGKIGSASYILNITKGYPDNRYNKISTNWKSTGAVHYLTESEVENNTPIDIEVWGGDCFITDYQVKVNNNTPRISDIFETDADNAKDYKLGTDTDYLTFDRSTKTGSFNNNVEIILLTIESEVNTGYLKNTDKIRYDKPTTYFSKPYLYQYNGSYSINNVLKAFVTKQQDIINNFNYQARFVWSLTRLYEAENSAFVNTEGFDFFPVNNKKDLDEQYGGITSLVDFGDYLLYLIQESKVRKEPINRTITNIADNQTQILLSTEFIGNSGEYLVFSNGSQHMRTVKYFNGTCFMLDAKRRMLVAFGGGYDVLSEKNMNRYFLENYADSHLLKEKDILGIINSNQEKEEYWLVKNDLVNPTTIIYNSKAKNFKSRINVGTDAILNGLSNGEFMFLMHNKNIFTAYTNNQFGFLLDKYRPSTFKMVINDYPGETKTFNVMDFEMRNGFILNKDNAFAEATSLVTNNVQQTPDMFFWNNATGQLAPLQLRNFRYWLNRIRQKDTKFKLRGDYMEVEFTINNDLADNREVGIAGITTECEVNARVR